MKPPPQPPGSAVPASAYLLFTEVFNILLGTAFLPAKVVTRISNLCDCIFSF